MKVQDRIKLLAGVEDAYWDSKRERLIIYYDELTPLDTIKLRVIKAIVGVRLQDSVKEITFWGY